MAGQEVKEAGVGNLGLQDRKFPLKICLPSRADLYIPEREALRWIQKYIGQFGGDPTKVTMYVARAPLNKTTRLTSPMPNLQLG